MTRGFGEERVGGEEEVGEVEDDSDGEGGGSVISSLPVVGFWVIRSGGGREEEGGCGKEEISCWTAVAVWRFDR